MSLDFKDYEREINIVNRLPTRNKIANNSLF